jgi:tetratricopeptide (TPR) repeat protein
MIGHTWKWMRFLAVTLLLGSGLLTGGCAGTLARVRDDYQAQRIYEAGLSRYKTKDYTGALQQFQRALELDPSFDEAKAHLAWSYYHAGEFIPATKHFRQALLRQPQWAGLHDGLGWSRYRMERYNLALEAFQQAVALDPSYRDADVGVAYTHFALGRYREALPRLERLTRDGEGNALRSASSDLEQVRSRYAWTLFYLGDYGQAREQFRKGIAARPDWAGLRNGMGWTLLQLNDPQRARDHFEYALKLVPDFADAKEGLSQARQAKM